MFYLARATAAQHSPEDAHHFGTLWERPIFVKCMYRLTLVWGLGLVLEACVRVGLAWRIPIEQFLVISPIIAYAAYFSLFGWTFWYVRRRKAAEARESADIADNGTRIETAMGRYGDRVAKNTNRFNELDKDVRKDS
jgi:hypothetical protein